MIDFRFSITNPWADDNKFKNLFSKATQLTKNKWVELEVLKDPSELIVLELRATIRCDHAGVSVTVGALGYSLLLRQYDTRHWDYKNKHWVVYENK